MTLDSPRARGGAGAGGRGESAPRTLSAHTSHLLLAAARAALLYLSKFGLLHTLRRASAPAVRRTEVLDCRLNP